MVRMAAATSSIIIHTIKSAIDRSWFRWEQELQKIDESLSALCYGKLLFDACRRTERKRVPVVTIPDQCL